MSKDDDNGKGPSLTFFQRNPIACPVCDAKIYREELLSGRGRLIAGDMTIELRRLFEPSKKYGEVSPLIYPVTVCPDCYFACFKEHFGPLPDKVREGIESSRDERIESTTALFPQLNFTDPRGFKEGLASYWLATMCYDHFGKEFSPVANQAVASVRAAWLCNDLDHQEPEENWAHLGRVFYRKARYFYSLALEYEQKGVQSIGNVLNLGPDMDKNYGYDGLIYLNGYLEYHFGPRKNPEIRRQKLERAKRMVARIFGMGKASKNKPMVLLENARELYNMIAKALGQEDANPEEDAQGDEE